MREILGSGSGAASGSGSGSFVLGLIHFPMIGRRLHPFFFFPFLFGSPSPSGGAGAFAAGFGGGGAGLSAVLLSCRRWAKALMSLCSIVFSMSPWSEVGLGSGTVPPAAPLMPSTCPLVMLVYCGGGKAVSVTSEFKVTGNVTTCF